MRQLDAFQFELPAEGVLPGERQVDADFDRISGGERRSGSAQRKSRNSQHQQTFTQFHP